MNNSIRETTAVSGVFEKVDQVIAKLEDARQMIHEALNAAEYAQPLGSRAYDDLKDYLSPAYTALANAVNFVSGEQRYVK